MSFFPLLTTHKFIYTVGVSSNKFYISTYTTCKNYQKFFCRRVLNTEPTQKRVVGRGKKFGLKMYVQWQGMSIFETHRASDKATRNGGDFVNHMSRTNACWLDFTSSKQCRKDFSWKSNLITSMVVFQKAVYEIKRSNSWHFQNCV